MKSDAFGRKRLLGIGLVVSVALMSSWWFLSSRTPRLISFGQRSADQGRVFSYERYGSVLQAYVDKNGMVDYQSLKAGPQPLDAFAAEIGRVSPAFYSGWNEKEQIAFWINAYNALTLEAILNHYPIQASLLRSALFPANSIRQIPGVWDRLQFVIMGERRTLGEIEHEILRKRFDEPRIHMALVCAANGCPPLRNEPYTGDQLDQQLADQTRRFLSNPTQFRIDRQNHLVYLSPIFEWFGSDFVGYGTDQGSGQQPDPEKAVLNFIMSYASGSDREYLGQGGYTVKYLNYDWSLNERVPGKKIS
jgi:hypothetical protein